MKREFLTDLGLEGEQVDAIMKEHGKSVNALKDEADKVDDLQKQVDDYKTQLDDRDKQLKDLEKSAKGNEDLQKEIKDLQKANDDTKKEYETKLAEQRKESKLELALKDAKAKNPRAVKALLDAEKVSLDGDNLIGLEDQLSALKESDAYLFGEDEPKGLKGREPHPSDPNKQQQGITKEQFNQMGYTDRVKLYSENPDLYKQLSE